MRTAAPSATKSTVMVAKTAAEMAEPRQAANGDEHDECERDAQISDRGDVGDDG